MELLTIKEVTKLLKVSRQSLSAWVKQGKLKVLKAGRNVRIEKAELERFLRSGNNGKN